MIQNKHNINWDYIGYAVPAFHNNHDTTDAHVGTMPVPRPGPLSCGVVGTHVGMGMGE